MSEQNNIIELLLYGNAKEWGLSGPTDYLAAAVLYTRAKELGSALAASFLERLIEKGAVTTVDIEGTSKSIDNKGQRAGRHQSKDLELQNRPKILVIEDGEDTLKVMAYILQQSGYNPVTAVDGIDGLVKTLAHPDIACMLIDLQMPNMNGFEFIAALRAQKAFEKTPVIIVTAHTDPKLLERGRQLMVNGWISKPIRKDLLIGNVTRALAKGVA